MAARDRFGAYADPSLSPLQRAIRMSPCYNFQAWTWVLRLLTTTIDNACDPANYEPNLALNLEVVDLINSKKGNA